MGIAESRSDGGRSCRTIGYGVGRCISLGRAGRTCVGIDRSGCSGIGIRLGVGRANGHCAGVG